MEFNSEETNYIKEITSLYQKVRNLIILAEELDPEKKTWMGGFDELRHSYDHFMRSCHAKLFQEKDLDVDYIKDNFNKSYAHLYRAGIDTLDWLNIIYYKQITDILSKYHSEIILSAIPEYYPSLRPEIEKIKNDIADYRASKDVARKDNSVFIQYTRKIERIKEIYEYIQKNQVSLIELKKRRRIESWKNKSTIIALISLIITIISVLFALYFAISQV